MGKTSNFKSYIIRNPTLPKDERALPTEFLMTPSQAATKNKELKAQNAPGRFVKAIKKQSS